MLDKKLTLILMSALVTAPQLARANAVTYDFTGTVSASQGGYSFVPLGTTVSGTYTFNLDAATPGQGAGVVGASSNWVVQSDGGAANVTVSTDGGVAHLPSPVPSELVFASTVEVDGISYRTAPPSPYVTEAWVDNQQSSLFAGEWNWRDSNTTTGSNLALAPLKSGVLPFFANGLPDPSEVGLAGSQGYFFYTASNSLSGQINWNLTSLSVAPAPVPLPAGVWLLASGLGALGAAARKKRSCG